ncbi:TIGR00730 family Rossman fold protein [Breznakiella homolactica]|uniref:Cytokinin riboside 5'-monophosphate phosphoribohydrolase n=1 Tax=Breznakiella homolactica TaxID=2798577 RepID=A0A7T8BAN0_9SPIR|nr:TIGR00730 family Rossman fold protein [Breznakiella homolactica]QQO08373.1 TIGR00730 family Rossman fold protein [Breznakiella homolactica]
MDISRICVFCGSSFGNDEKYREYASELGKTLAENGITLIYGAGSRGLMGEVALSAKRSGGYVTGVSPERFHSHSRDFEIDEYILVETMHQRKETMYRLAQGFIVMPGGIGTLDEFAEIFTWLQIGLSDKPVALLNVEGFFDPLIAMLDRMTETGFMEREKRNLLIVEDTGKKILDRFGVYEPQFRLWKAP